MKKRIIICADGTWNAPDQVDEKGVRKPSNVVKMARAILPQAADEKNQIVFYDQGVGTDSALSDKIIGGAFGKGLTKNILDCYRFIVHNYNPGDEVFLFGFSRGAFTVRSLAGLIGSCGLLTKADAYYIPDAYQLYRLKNSGSGKQEKIRLFKTGKHSKYREAPAREIDIQFLGVWDTVGALGIPKIFSQKTRKKFTFHDVKLGSNVKNAFHALAIDEKRKPFRPTLWEGQNHQGQTVEQFWFAGVHTNIGGGYDNDGLANCAFQWMLEKAERSGLEVDKDFTKNYRSFYKDEIHDSLSFIYRIFGKFLRPIGRQTNGHENIHETALKRLKTTNPPKPEYGGPYQPKNLIEYLKERGEL
jgi:uncharacterized protein (DUF2235 family)